MAPEVLRIDLYDERADVWSFACLMECMVTHRRLYAAHGSETAAGEAEVMHRFSRVKKDFGGSRRQIGLAELR